MGAIGEGKPAADCGVGFTGEMFPAPLQSELVAVVSRVTPVTVADLILLELAVVVLQKTVG